MTRLDAWDEIVGIPLELWMAAETRADLVDLLAHRDAGTLYPKPETMVEHRLKHPDHAMVDLMTYNQADPVIVLCATCGHRFALGSDSQEALR